MPDSHRQQKILDGICLQLHLDTDSMKVNKSYAVLENYGNLSSASTGFMLAGKKEWADPAMVVGFGVGFTASAGLMSVNQCWERMHPARGSPASCRPVVARSIRH